MIQDTRRGERHHEGQRKTFTTEDTTRDLPTGSSAAERASPESSESSGEESGSQSEDDGEVHDAYATYQTAKQ
eukprot:7072713-Alexandrium_andersonii.AAC.1